MKKIILSIILLGVLKNTYGQEMTLKDQMAKATLSLATASDWGMLIASGATLAERLQTSTEMFTDIKQMKDKINLLLSTEDFKRGMKLSDNTIILNKVRFMGYRVAGFSKMIYQLGVMTRAIPEESVKEMAEAMNTDLSILTDNTTAIVKNNTPFMPSSSAAVTSGNIQSQQKSSKDRLKRSIFDLLVMMDNLDSYLISCYNDQVALYYELLAIKNLGLGAIGISPSISDYKMYLANKKKFYEMLDAKERAKYEKMERMLKEENDNVKKFSIGKVINYEVINVNPINIK